MPSTSRSARMAQWYVVQDLTDAPPGIGYALLDRSVTSRVVPDVMAHHEIASIARYTGSMRRALAASSPAAEPAHRRVLGRSRPSVVRRPLVPRGAARRASRRGRRPRGAPAAGVAAHARRARAGRRALPAARGPDRRSARGRGARIARRSRRAAGGAGRRRGARQCPRGRVSSRRRSWRPSSMPRSSVCDRAASRRCRGWRRISRPLARGADDTRRGRPVRRGVGRVADVRRRRRVERRGAAGWDGARAGARGRSTPSDGLRGEGRVGAGSHADADHRTAAAAGRLRPIVADRARPTPCTGRTVPRSGLKRWRAPRVSSPRASSRIPGWRCSTAGSGTAVIGAVLRAVRRGADADSRVGRRPAGRARAARPTPWRGEIGTLLTEATTVREYLSVTTGRVLAHLAELRDRAQHASGGCRRPRRRARRLRRLRRAVAREHRARAGMADR